MGKPNFFELQWIGCDCTAEDKGVMFDKNYNRYCKTCKAALYGQWKCMVCDLDTEHLVTKTSKGIKIDIECCPKCGNVVN